MTKKLLALALIGLIVNIAMVPCMAAQDSAKKIKDEAKHARRAKKAVSVVGVGRNANIEVRLRDKTELKGFVSETRDDDFVIVDKANGVATTVPYSQVEKVKAWPSLKNALRQNIASPGQFFKRLAIGAGIAVGGFIDLLWSQQEVSGIVLLRGSGG